MFFNIAYPRSVYFAKTLMLKIFFVLDFQHLASSMQTDLCISDLTTEKKNEKNVCVTFILT